MKYNLCYNILFKQDQNKNNSKNFEMNNVMSEFDWQLRSEVQSWHIHGKTQNSTPFNIKIIYETRVALCQKKEHFSIFYSFSISCNMLNENSLLTSFFFSCALLFPTLRLLNNVPLILQVIKNTKLTNHS